MPLFSSSFRIGVSASRAVWISVACALVIMLLTAVLELRGYNDAVATAERDTRNLAAVLDSHTAALAGQADMVIRIVTTLLDGTVPDSDTAQVLRDTVIAQTVLHTGLQDVLVYDARGALVASSYSDARGHAGAAGREFFQHHQRTARDTLHVGHAYRAAAGSPWVIPLSRRLTGRDGRFAGVVVVPMQVSELVAHFQELDLGPDGVVALNTADGVLLARHPVVEGAIGTDLSHTPVYAALAERRERGNVSFRSPVDGVERIHGFTRVTGYPLTLVVGVSRSHVLAAWRQTAWRDVVVVGALLGVLGVAVWRNRCAAARHERDARQLARAHRRLADLEKAINEHAVVAITDVHGTIVHANDHFCSLSGYRRDELVGQNHRIVRSGHHDTAFWREMWRTVAQGGIWKGEVLNRAKDGTPYWVQATIVPFLNARGKPDQYIAIRTDITARKQAEEHMRQAMAQLDQANQRLARLAARDALTGLPNRRQFDEQSTEEIQRARRDGSSLALLMIDVDHFKAYNDQLGHAQGDECLKRVATAVAGVQRRPGDLVARWGGEEFAVLLPQTDRAGAEHVARRLIERLERLGLPHPASPLGRVSVSVGLHVMRPATGGTVGALLEGADTALYLAKRAGRNRLASAADVQSVADRRMSLSEEAVPGR
ncbi:diguanylate cyclase domain-containing protein [Ideonella sp.]|uniref:diguanylate cyclase domain-containing protein n=1 Tax=Ideonella sp. TaxID=1929293 RepID=UPI0035B28645